MKIRFYCDLPPMMNIMERPRFWSVAAETPISPLQPNWKRIIFDVNFPSDKIKNFQKEDLGIVSNFAVLEDSEE